MKYRWLILDGNWLLHLLFSVIDNNRPEKEFLSLFVKNFFARIKFVTHPSGSASRKKILESYKAGRKEKPGLSEAMKLAKVGLKTINIIQVESPEGEGDDVIATMCRQFKNCCIYSADKDFLQLVNLSTHLYKVSSNKLVTISNIQELILEKVGGFDPKQWGDYLKIRGDTADNLAGLPGVGPVKADFVDLIVSGNAYAFAKVKEIMGAKGNDMLKLAKLGIKERDNLILAKKIVDLYTVKLHYTRPKPSKKSFGQFMLDVGQQHMTEQLYVD
jgi:DNA polymerase-1